MNEYVAVLVFILAFANSIYYALCIPPEPRPTALPFKSGGDASLSFIAGEAGVPRYPQSAPRPQYPQLSNTRDFLTPRQPTSSNIAPPGANFNPNVPNTPKTAPSASSRDYVNPNYNPNQKPNLPQSSSINTGPTTLPNQKSPPSSSSNPVSLSQIFKLGPPQSSGTRDFVNPNYKLVEPFSELKPVPGSPPGSALKPRDPFPALKPASKPVEPFSELKPVPGSPQGSVSRPRDPFPALKPRRDPFPPVRSPVPPGVGRPGAAVAPPGPVVSYAEKASGGATTARPLVPKPTGPTGSASGAPGAKEADAGPRDNELREFSEVLLKKDVNNAFKYVKLNIQGKTTSQSKNDEAPQNLLEIDNAAFKIPTVEKLRAFYNNYILEVTENEYVTPQEKAEENDFLDAVLATPVMQHTRNFLIANGKLSKDPKDLKDLLRTTWFSLYSRGGGRVGSSGFEHIFLAELKTAKNEVSGLHNWLYFSQAEKNKLANYLGYMKKIDLGDKGAILKFHMSLQDVDKPVNSIFVGTSPEFEMALYTTCYVFRPNRVCPLRLAGKNFIVRAYSLRYRGKQLLGSAFPEI